MQLKTIRVDIFYKSGTLKNTKLLVKSGKAGAERFVKQCGVDLGDIVNRITSYNVCYTKLLRLLLSRSGVVCPT